MSPLLRSWIWCSGNKTITVLLFAACLQQPDLQEETAGSWALLVTAGQDSGCSSFNTAEEWLPVTYSKVEANTEVVWEATGDVIKKCPWP